MFPNAATVTVKECVSLDLLELRSVRLIWVVSPVVQLQLEIALLQGELQTERKQLHRHTQKLQALQQQTGHSDTHRHTNRHKVRPTTLVYVMST